MKSRQTLTYSARARLLRWTLAASAALACGGGTALGLAVWSQGANPHTAPAPVALAAPPQVVVALPPLPPPTAPSPVVTAAAPAPVTTARPAESAAGARPLAAAAPPREAVAAPTPAPVAVADSMLGTGISGSSAPPQPAGGAAAATLVSAAPEIAPGAGSDQPSARELAGTRVFIHYRAGDGAGEQTAAKLAQFLKSRGIAVAGLRPVAMRIGSWNLRYFFGEDRGPARDLRALVAAFRKGDQAAEAVGPELIDFTNYAPKPRAGTVEVWLPS